MSVEWKNYGMYQIVTKGKSAGNVFLVVFNNKTPHRLWLTHGRGEPIRDDIYSKALDPIPANVYSFAPVNSADEDVFQIDYVGNLSNMMCKIIRGAYDGKD